MKVKVIAKLNKRLWPSTKNTPLPNPHLPGDIIEVESELKAKLRLTRPIPGGIKLRVVITFGAEAYCARIPLRL